MLKKVGIVAAAATAAMVALSPLAFADDHHDEEVTNVWIDDNSVERDQVNRCDFDQDIDGSPITAIQDQSFNCINVGDNAELPAPPAPPLLPPVVPVPA